MTDTHTKAVPSGPQLVHPSQSPMPNHDHADEIDLVELVRTLWREKLLITLFTVIFALAGVGYALTAQEWWTAKAKVIQPQITDFAQLQREISAFQPAFDIYQADGTVLVSTQLTDVADAELLFKNFVNGFNSLENKKAFLMNSTNFQQYLTENQISEADEENMDRTLENWFDKISAQPASKQESDIYVINLQATTSNSSFQMLKQYIDYVSAKVYHDTLANVQALVLAKENELQQQLRVLRNQASSYLAVEKERTQYALDIASAADVNQPVQNLGDGEIFAINLGSKALAAKVSALESVKNLSVVEPRIQQVEARLSLLRGTALDKDIRFQTYRFLENVEKPITKDKPKRALIVVIATLLGGMLGVAFVLIRTAFRNHD
ncbi:LPS O-antigen chain length determinant protein WzzB [Photobacterium sp. 1_MG-2023]|uniref:LPS O-antigen chain length determinant protein WzzB n=1 Tax=Photobacterium sp. 1_MG-2023 TaxID=3062646 RepID=UPI0026E48F15|nr:Wzz/FepE/Etk N-terminal domain-containing protein [Photobacterium sp. 1_MG-2023]MDO6707179.1 Wzz/FepE/Etk N-terminal domain-containing protein [Photobacterium sp. 1_MG-2023]